MPDSSRWLVDSQTTVVDGMNGSRDPALIGEQQAALLRNISTRGGRAKSRPRFVRRATLPTGKMQGLYVFGATGTLMFSASGRVYEIDPKGWTTEERTSASDRNNANLPRHYYAETVSSIVIQDGQSKAIVYDGAQFRRAASDEVPTGTAMSFGNGRLAVAINKGAAIRIGDIRQPQHQSELKFTEWTSLSGGGDLAFTSPVLSLSHLPVIDTGSGHGPLIVGCRDSTYTLKTQVTQRSLWNEIGFQTIILPGRGITGFRAAATVNQDLYFRSSDGLRSLRTSTADYDAPGLSSLSTEVRNRFGYDTPSLLEDAQVVLFDNRLLVTHSPFVYKDRSLAQGLIALNFDSISGRGQKSPPIYDGEWDEMVIADISVGTIDGKERCFLSGRDSSGVNALWELLPETSPKSGDTVTQALETRTLFGDSPGTTKHLVRADMWFSDIVGDVAVRLKYRPAHYPYWLDWKSFTVTASGTHSTWNTLRSQRRSPLQAGAPAELTDPQTNRRYSTAEGFDVRVEWDGVAMLDRIQVWQERVKGSVYADDPVTDSPILVEPPAGATEPSFWNPHTVSPLAGIE